MINTYTLKHRDQYLKKLTDFQDMEPVKVITGIRRCGKSSLLKLMVQHLKNSGISPSQIVEMNFESFEFMSMTANQIYLHVRDQVIPGKRMYLFFDEIQRISGWEDSINAMRVDLDCDIYVTGSNAYLLSSDYATYLSGRCVEIRMLPLSFREFLDFHGYELRKVTDHFGEDHTKLIDQAGTTFELRDAFNEFLRYGGMPGLTEGGLNREKALTLLDDIYSTVVVRDILERKKRYGQGQVTDLLLLRKISLFLADNIGSNISLTNVGNTLMNEGLLDGKKSPSTHTVQSYVNALIESYFFYEIKRFDIKGREYLRTLGKYYIVDIGLRNFLLGFRDRDRGHVLENIVYFELKRRGYDVAIGKVGQYEIDFIANRPDDKKYIQVTESMLGEEIRNRELKPLMMIPDQYEKIVLSLDPGLDSVYEGIKSVNLIDWLLED